MAELIIRDNDVRGAGSLRHAQLGQTLKLVIDVLVFKVEDDLIDVTRMSAAGREILPGSRSVSLFVQKIERVDEQ
jgi:hypothetical protein